MKIAKFSKAEAITSGYKCYTYGVTNFDTAVGFYNTLFETLNFISHELEGVKTYCFKDLHVYFELRMAIPTRTRRYYKSKSLNSDPISIRVNSKEQVDVIYESLSKFDVIDHRQPRYYDLEGKEYYALYFNDIEGFPVEIFC